MSSDLKFFNPPSNYNKLLNNPAFIQTLLSKVRNGLGRQLNQSEKIFLINFLQNINPILFKHEPKVILEKLVVGIVEQISKNECYDEQTDIHEMLKTEIGVSTEDIKIESDTDFTQQITNNFANTVDVASIFGSKTFNDLQSIFAPATTIRSAYVLLDTRYRVLDNDGRTVIKWNFVNNNNVSQGSVNAIGDIQNIISMRVSPMQMPYTSQADNDYKRVTMYVQEFSAQSVVAQENRQYHFIFPITVGDRWINLEVPRDADGIYRFRNPISRIDSLNITFGSPLQQITFDADRRNMLVESYGSVITFLATDPHNLETGDLVYVTYFTTANPNIDVNIISGVNAVNGVIATYVDDLRISIAVDTTLLKYNGAGTVSVVNGSTTVTGAGTTFTTMFVVNDIINILGIRYTVASITSNTVLDVSVVYADATAAGLAYSKSNEIPGLNPSFYFGSKRMLIPMEFEYMI